MPSTSAILGHQISLLIVDCFHIRRTLRRIMANPKNTLGILKPVPKKIQILPHIQDRLSGR